MKRIIALLLVAAGALMAGGADAESLRVGTPAGANFTFLPARIGADRGAFKAEGLDVEVTDFGGGAKLQQAMISGAIDMTVSAGTDLAFIGQRLARYGRRRDGQPADARHRRRLRFAAEECRRSQRQENRRHHCRLADRMADEAADRAEGLGRRMR